jgi:uncharacterized protein YdeI (YjbR/CyaY-like superfamily)
VEILACASAAEWQSWLAAHHAVRDSVWLRVAKKSSGKTSVTLAEALDVALCFGWIDSQRKPDDDDHHYLQRYSPRRRKSPWSRINVEKAEALIAAGRMREPGLAAIEAARADGRFGRVRTAKSVSESARPRGQDARGAMRARSRAGGGARVARTLLQARGCRA